MGNGDSSEAPKQWSLEHMLELREAEARREHEENATIQAVDPLVLTRALARRAEEVLPAIHERLIEAGRLGNLRPTLTFTLGGWVEPYDADSELLVKPAICPGLGIGMADWYQDGVSIDQPVPNFDAEAPGRLRPLNECSDFEMGVLLESLPELLAGLASASASPVGWLVQDTPAAEWLISGQFPSRYSVAGELLAQKSADKSKTRADIRADKKKKKSRNLSKDVQMLRFERALKSPQHQGKSQKEVAAEVMKVPEEKVDSFLRQYRRWKHGQQ